MNRPLHEGRMPTLVETQSDIAVRMYELKSLLVEIFKKTYKKRHLGLPEHLQLEFLLLLSILTFHLEHFLFHFSFEIDALLLEKFLLCVFPVDRLV